MVNQDNSNTADQKPPSPRLKLGSKKIIIATTVFLVVAVAGGVGWYVSKGHTNQKEVPNVHREAAPVSVIGQVDEPQTEYGKTLVAADALMNKQDYDGALKPLQKYEPKATTSTERYAIWGRLGALYAYKKDYKTAITWYERAEQTKEPGSDSLVLFVADAAEKSGDKPKAIAAYNKAIELLKANPNPSSQAGIARYQEKIKALGG